MSEKSEYTVRKSGDNYELCFRGSRVECGLFATRTTAMKYKAISEYERRQSVCREKLK